MAFVHNMSCECTKSELDLFTIPPTQTGIEHGQWVEYRPLSTLSDGAPIEFGISGSGEDYMDLANTHLHIEGKIVQVDGANIAAAAAVGPVNLLLHSLFSQVDVSLNEKLITPSTNTYPYRAYLETLLSYGPAAKDTQLSSSLWYEDTAGHMDDVADNNVGLNTRKAFTALSTTVELMGRLHCDFFFQDRYLLNGVDLKIRLVRSKDAFALMAGGANPSFKFSITQASLFVRKVHLSSTAQLGHIRALENGTAKYPVRRVETKVFAIPRGNRMTNQENVFLGQLPKRIVIGCVGNDAFNGSYAKNPYHFQHFDINFLALYVDGHQIPAKPLQPDFARGRYMRAYTSLFAGTGQLYQDEGNNITREEYAQGYTLFAFDLTPDLNEGDHFNVVKQGNLRLEIHFGAALADTINVVVYAEFENVIEIDRSRNIIFDYTA